MSDSPLARYQSALLALLLREDVDGDARLAILREDPAFAPYGSYTSGVDRAFLEQGARATQRWSRAAPAAGKAARMRPNGVGSRRSATHDSQPDPSGGAGAFQSGEDALD